MQLQPRWLLRVVPILALSLAASLVPQRSEACAQDRAFAALAAGGEEPIVPSDPGCEEEGDPVSPFSGKFFVEYTDLVVDGVYPIRIVRRYDSQTSYDSALGAGWAFTYDMRLLKFAGGDAILRSGAGKREFFAYDSGTGTYSSPIGTRETLSVSGSGHVLSTRKGAKAVFNAQGRLERLEDPQGNQLVFTYDNTGRKPIKGISKYAATSNPTPSPTTVAYHDQLLKIEEYIRVSAGTTVATGRYVSFDTYNPSTGRLEQISSSDGRTVTYSHEPHPASGLTNGNLTQVIGLESIVQTMVYQDPNDLHNVTSIQVGAATTPQVNVYDSEDRVQTQTTGNSVLTFQYDTPVANATTVTRDIEDDQGDPVGTATTIYEFDAEGYTLKITDALGHERIFTRYSSKFVWTDTLKRKIGQAAPTVQKTTTYTYEPGTNNLLTKVVTLESGETITETWTYDQNWTDSHKIESSDNGSTLFQTDFEFERNHLALGETGYNASHPITNISKVKRRKDDGTFEVTTLDYDPSGQLVSRELPDLHIIGQVYFPLTEENVAARARLRRVFHEVSVGGDDCGGGEDCHLRTSFAYDTKGHLSSVTDARNNPTTFQRDDLGRIEMLKNAKNEENHLIYTGPDRASPGFLLTQLEYGRTTAGAGHFRKYFYDGRGNLTQIQRLDQGTYKTFQSFSYDSDLNRVSITDAESRKWVLGYDFLGRLSTVDDPDQPTANRTTYEYDAAGNRTKETAIVSAPGVNRVTDYVYDDLDRLTTVTQPNASPVRTVIYDYDAAGNIEGITDGKDNTTDYEFNALSQLVKITPEKLQGPPKSIDFDYDTRGRLQNRYNAEGTRLEYVYVTWGPLKELRFYPNGTAQNPDRTVSFKYDLAGNLEEAGDDDPSLVAAIGGTPQTYNLYHVVHDELNRPDVVTVRYLPGGNRVIDHRYDRFGNRDQLVVTDPAGNLQHDYAFDDLENLETATLPGPGGSQAIDFTFWDDDRLQSVTRASGVVTDVTYEPTTDIDVITVTDSGSKVLQSLDYGYSDVRSVTSLVADWGGSYSYDYHATDELKQAVYPSGVGFPAISQEDYTYDAAGNRDNPSSDYTYNKRNEIEAGPSYSYVHDDDGNLESRSGGRTFAFDAQARLTSISEGTSTYDYHYDHVARRIRKTSLNGKVTWFLWDGDQLLAEYNASGSRTARYAYGEGSTFTGFLPLQFEQGAALYDVHGDRLDAPRMLTDGAETKKWRAAYEAFGRGYVESGSTAVMNLRLPGQYLDAESSLHYNRNRYFAPSTGRYLSPDPIGQWGVLAASGVAQSRPLFPSGASSSVVLGYLPSRAGRLYFHSRRLDHPDRSLLSFGLSAVDLAVAGRWIGQDSGRLAGDGPNPFTYAESDPAGSIDPRGEYGWLGGLGGAGLNLALQFGATYYQTNGNIRKAYRCVNWADVGISGLVGAVGPTFFGNVLIGNPGPFGASRGVNAAGFLLGTYPTGILGKSLAPDLRIGSDCECAGLSGSDLASKLVHGL